MIKENVMENIENSENRNNCENICTKMVGYGYQLAVADVTTNFISKVLNACLNRSRKFKKPLGILISYRSSLKFKFVDVTGKFFTTEDGLEFNASLEQKFSTSAGGQVIYGINGTEIAGNVKEKLEKAITFFGKSKFKYLGNVTYPELFYACNTGLETYGEYMLESYLKLQQITNNSFQMSTDISYGVIKKHFALFNQNKQTYIEILEPTYENYLEKGKNGAEYVYTYKKKPKVAACNSLVGVFSFNADKLIFYKEHAKNLRIFNGDSICTFFACYITDIVRDLDIKVGAVLNEMTSTICMDYLRSKNINFTISKSFIFKDMIEQAQSYEIGLAWTPNGHGTIVFSDAVILKLEQMKSTTSGILLCLKDLFGRNCTDALGIFLACKAILTSQYDMNLFAQTYTRILEININKNIELSGSIVVEPSHIQKEINHWIDMFSGRIVLQCTEKTQSKEDKAITLKVFAEGGSQENCDILCLKVATLIFEECGGIGNYPLIRYSNYDFIQ